MNPSSFARTIFAVLLIAATAAGARDLEVTYPASSTPGELALGVTYRLWMSDGVKTVRGVIVHQHGCGEGASKGAVTAAADLHWQALARKWDCALLGPQYHQAEKDNCRLWCDPRNGSDVTFRRALAAFARESGHPELEHVPWCLWGHSGGGFWSSLMLTLHPERIVAIWLRSGSAFGAWSKGEIPVPTLRPEVYGVPVLFNGGVKEEQDKRHGPPRVADRAMFRMWREHGAPAAFAADPRTGHECGDSRYLAIPFFDACLALRLPEKGSAARELKPIDMKSARFAPMHGEEVSTAAGLQVDPLAAGWVPDEDFGRMRAEYIRPGATTGDTTPPPAPTGVKRVVTAAGVELTWHAEADFESGLQGFVVQRDGVEIARLPEKPVSKFGRPLFQGMSYGDTPVIPLPEMRYVDTTGAAGGRGVYRIVAVNGGGLQSAPTVAE